MGKIANPIRFSEHFGVDAEQLIKLGALDPTLNLDTNLFIDPLLLRLSEHSEIKKDGYALYCKHFEQVITLLKASQQKDDTYWRNAKRLMTFPEIKNTCLGYGAASVSGSGSGSSITDFVMQTAKDVVNLGIVDPDIFVAMAIFEEGIGPDRISDMTTNVIIESLIKYTERVCSSLEIPTQLVSIRSGKSASISAKLPINPFFGDGRTGVILVPQDILRALPVAKCWDDISSAASKANQLRHEINQDILNIWKRKTLKEKDLLKGWALGNKDNFETILNALKSSGVESYDFESDPKGEIFWRGILERLASEEPFVIQAPLKKDANAIHEIVEAIIKQFKFLVEDRRLSEELYAKGSPRPEKSAQRLFYAVAHAYCKANNIDITPEADTGNGPVDFKFSKGYSGRILVEIKLSTNPKVIQGYTKQIEAYSKGETPDACYYLIIDVGGLTQKKKRLAEIQRNESSASFKKIIKYVDGHRTKAASKR